MELASEGLSMALVDFQTALGRLVGVQNGTDPFRGLNLDTGETLNIQALQETAGFVFCRSIQRSWCIGRAAKSAQLTLSLLQENERQELLDEWIDSGAGTQSFYDAQAESFLDFISRRLVNPSHQLSVCQLEQATLRAGEGINHFAAPDLAALRDPDCMVRRGRYAALVEFYAEPNQVMLSVQKHEPLPPLSSEVTALFFGPGVEQLCYAPAPDEVDLWHQLELAQPVRAFLSQGYARETLEKLLSPGMIEYAE
jgi:hypothetical protein